jgi:hypothetical protein
MRHVSLRGKDLHSPSNEIVENNTGTTINGLRVVSLDGYGVKFPQIKLGNPNLFPSFGVTYESIENGKTGLVCVIGFMYELDTSSFSVGDVLYSDSNGNLTTTVLGPSIAVVVKVDPDEGIIRVSSVEGDIGSATAWDVDGNGGTDPAINFLGTTDNQPIVFRTNNEFKAILDENGRFGLGTESPNRHFHIKSHVGDPTSGLQLETFGLESSTDLLTPIYEIMIPNPSVVRIEVVVIARQSIGGERAMFKRTGLFFREGGNVQIEGGTWLSDQTIKSNNTFDIGYIMGTSSLNISVKNANNILTKWTGHVKIEILA